MSRTCATCRWEDWEDADDPWLSYCHNCAYDPGHYNWQPRDQTPLNNTVQKCKPLPAEGNTGLQSEGV